MVSSSQCVWGSVKTTLIVLGNTKNRSSNSSLQKKTFCKSYALRGKAKMLLRLKTLFITLLLKFIFNNYYCAEFMIYNDSAK